MDSNYQIDNESLYNMYILCEGVEIALAAQKLGIPNKTYFKKLHLLDHNYAKEIEPDHEPVKRSHDDKENIDLNPLNKKIKREPFESIENKQLEIKSVPNVSARKTRHSLSSRSNPFKENSLPSDKMDEFVLNKSNKKIELNEIVKYAIKILPDFFTLDELKNGIFKVPHKTKYYKSKRKSLDQTKTDNLKRAIAEKFSFYDDKNEKVWNSILKNVNRSVCRKDSKN